MHPDNLDVIMQFVQLSKTLEKSFKIKPELFEAHSIYLELLEVRQKLAEVESSFPTLH
jgi:hypothetical protein